MDIQENVGAIPPTAAAASSNQDQPVEGDQHSQQQSDPQLQETTDQGSELVNTYSGGYNANGGTGAEGYVYGEYNGDMLSEEFARGQMVVRSCASMHILCYVCVYISVAIDWWRWVQGYATSELGWFCK